MASMWFLDLDEEVSALRKASRRRMVANAADEFSVFAGHESSFRRRLSLGRDHVWDDAPDLLFHDFPAASSGSSISRRNSSRNTRRLFDGDDGAESEISHEESFCQATERNQKVEAFVTDVMEVNRQWQKHHSKRKVCMQNVHEPPLERRLPRPPSEELPKYGGVSVTPERLAQIEADNAQLRLDLDAAHRKVQAMEKEHLEHVQLLNIQVRSYRDDWEAERREKDQALKDKVALEEKCRLLEEQLLIMKRAACPIEKAEMNIAPCGCPQTAEAAPAAVTCVQQHGQCPRNKTHHSNNTFRTSVHLPCAPNKVIRRADTMESTVESSCGSSPSLSASTESGIVTIGYEDGLASVTSFTYPESPRSISSACIEIGANCNDDEPSYGCKRSASGKAAVEDDVEEGTLTQTREEIICPRCERIFPPDNHLDFLDHFERCPSQSATSVARINLQTFSNK